MSSFAVILSKIFEKNSEPNSYDSYIVEQFNSEKIPSTTDYVTHKFNKLKYVIIQSYFCNKLIKNRNFNIFCDSQKIYKIFCFLARSYKTKNAIKSENNNNDLYYNDISNFSNKSLINIYIDETRTIYTIRMSDMIQIINTSLTYAPDFFAEPYKIKNPWTNVEFTQTELYNIYFNIKSSNFIIPHFFHQFYLNDFNLLEFSSKNEVLLREETIKKFVTNSTFYQKYKYIYKMLIEFNKSHSIIKIDVDFPTKKIVEVFSYLLNDYLIYEYSFISSLKQVSKQYVKHELKKFKLNNPKFGRKIIIKKYNHDNNSVFHFGNTKYNYTRVYKFIDTVNNANENIDSYINKKQRNKFFKKRHTKTKRFRRQQNTYDLDKLFTWNINTVSLQPTIQYLLLQKSNKNFSNKIIFSIFKYTGNSSFNVQNINTFYTLSNIIAKYNLHYFLNRPSPNISENNEIADDSFKKECQIMYFN
tara:strand:- start:8684 stop:10099 length:1416 start_codon:yes stop_codon:yes gene_type:complete